MFPVCHKLSITMRRCGQSLVKHRKHILVTTAALTGIVLGGACFPWIGALGLGGASGAVCLMKDWEGPAVISFIMGIIVAAGIPMAGHTSIRTLQANAFKQAVQAAFKSEERQLTTITFKNYAYDWGRKERSVTFESNVVCSNDADTVKVIEARQIAKKGLTGGAGKYEKTVTASFERVSTSASWAGMYHFSSPSLGNLDCK